MLTVHGLHHLADMNSVIGLGAQASRMRNRHRRHDGDREHGKHGDEAREHGEKISIAQENVHCRELLPNLGLNSGGFKLPSARSEREVSFRGRED